MNGELLNIEEIIGILEDLKDRKVEEKVILLYNINLNKTIIEFSGRWEEERILFTGRILKIPGFYDDDINTYLSLYTEHIAIFFGTYEIIVKYKKAENKKEYVNFEGEIFLYDTTNKVH